jgi:uncharacterized membrane protein YdjX (TVP38/TMEM64 family)
MSQNTKSTLLAMLLCAVIVIVGTPLLMLLFDTQDNVQLWAKGLHLMALLVVGMSVFLSAIGFFAIPGIMMSTSSKEESL